MMISMISCRLQAVSNIRVLIQILEGIVRQKKISMADGVILILSATLGAQFQFSVGPMLEEPTTCNTDIMSSL